MTSQIQTTAIDVDFPVAGQDNDSQGFRDNFTVIQTALATAASEITVLQAESARTGVDNNFNGNLISNAQTNQLYGTVYPTTNPPVGSVVLDYEEAEMFTVRLTTAGNRSIRINNWPTGKDQAYVYAKVKIFIKNDTAAVSAGSFVVGKKYMITDLGDTTQLQWNAAAGSTGVTYAVGDLFTAATAGDSGTGTVVEVLTVSFVANSAITDYEVAADLLVEAWTPDNGTTVYFTKLSGLNLPASLFGSQWQGEEQVEDLASVSLSKTAGYFVTAENNLSSTLAAGTEGQIKVLAMDTFGGGNMVVTVTNPGWKTTGTGTITFSQLGQACTLQYINNQWFCVGNNGPTFA